MIDYIEVINNDELDLEASYHPYIKVVTITQFGLIYQEDSDEEPAKISIHINDYHYFLQCLREVTMYDINGLHFESAEGEFSLSSSDINFKVWYTPWDTGDTWEVTMDGQSFIFEQRHIDELARLLAC